MNINKLLSRLLLFVIPLYFTQGWLFGSGSITSQILIGVWIAIDFFYLFVYVLKVKRDYVSNLIFLFWILNIIYWMLSPKEVYALGRSFNTFGDFKNTTVVVLSYFPFAFFQKKRVVDIKYMRWFFMLFLIAAVVAFMMKQEALLEEFGIDKTNNTAYYFVVLLPFLGAYWKDKKFWIWFVVIIIFLLFCVKRGAIVCGIITYVVYLILDTKGGNKKLFSRIVGVAIFSVIIVLIVNYISSASDLLQRRMLSTQEGDSSGRDEIYSNLWNLFINSNAINQIFGYGMSQTVTFVGGYAHNDWIELLIDEGLLGVASYAAIFFSCLKFYNNNKKNMIIDNRFMFMTAFLCLLFRTTFSMGYLAPESALFFIAIACARNLNIETHTQL